ncbi:hypothetical protein FLP10_06150 [Agromyces intestinalis]|uniref:FtsX-like permease family protein n=1 Tax=Agromyces intestinalis TaxID=2592652 RepID=A0A5C1YEY1_9MICO|nr:hypothetical protein [Agromyces intestinalis]QEO14050.1 hypothetical protein FLP10_06150 [Agromyces intestinalis]
MHRGIPGPLRRLARDRLRLGALALNAAATAAIAGVQAGAAATLQQTLDEHWRGAYDLIVTADAGDGGGTVAFAAGASGAPGASDLTDAPVAGGPASAPLLAPNALAADPEAGVTSDQLEAIRAIAGVDVAAPLARVLLPRIGGGTLRFSVPIDAGRTTPDPRAWRATVRVLTDDGLGPRLVTEQSVALVVDDADVDRVVHLRPDQVRPDDFCVLDGVSYPMDSPEADPCRWRDVHTVAVRTGSQVTAGGEVVDGRLVFDVIDTPRANPVLTLVDAAAERELLGEAGAFLDPLVAARSAGTDASRLRSWLEQQPGEVAAHSVGTYAAMQQRADDLATTWVARGLPLDALPSGLPDGLPVLVGPTADQTLRLEVDLEDFGPTAVSDRIAGGYAFPDALIDGLPGEPAGRIEADAGALLDPLSDARIVLPWPGTEAPALDPLHPDFPAFDGGVPLAAPHYRPTEAGPRLDAERYSPGYRSLLFGYEVGSPVLETSPGGGAVGSESVYGTLGDIPTLDQGEPVAQQLVPVGELDLDGVSALADPLAAAPLGAYESAGAILVADGDGEPVDPTELRPNLSGTGLVNAATTLVADLASVDPDAADVPIQAVRVRVAGIDEFDADALARIDGVAQRIRALGLDVVHAAGSSPIDVDVAVGGYAFGTLDAASPQRVGALGVVRQRWTELEAASRVGSAISTATTIALGAGLGAAALLVGASTLVAIPGRRRVASTLRMIGWRRRRIVQWFGLEELIAVGVIAATGTAAVLVARDRGLTLIGAAAAVTIVAAFGAASVIAGSQGETRPRGRRSAVARVGRRGRTALRPLTAARFGVRQVRIHPLFAASVVLTMLTAAGAAVSITTIVLAERDAAGASLLAGFALGQALAARLLLAGVALVAAAVLGVLSRRLEIRRRAAQDGVLRAIGWTGAERRRAWRAESLAIIGPAAVVVTTVAAAITAAVRPGDTVLLAGITAASATLAGTATLATRRRTRHGASSRTERNRR